jgi:hypothetical protein
LRFLLFLPVVVVNCVLPTTLLDPFEEGVILTGLVCANFGWWCNFKLLAYSLDRGQGAGDKLCLWCSAIPSLNLNPKS